MRVDMHIHTWFSDGDYSPEEIVRKAVNAGLEKIAITDHDTVQGIERAVAEAERFGLELVPGVEVSASYNGLDVHILGYFPITDYRILGELDEILSETRVKRTEKARQIVDRITSRGFDVSFEDVKVEAKNGTYISRTHIAKVLFRKGIASSVKEGVSFTEKKGIFYVPYPRKLPTPKEAIKMIKSCGGEAILAHPARIAKEVDIDPFVQELISYGLDGIEFGNGNCLSGDYSYLLSKYNLTRTFGSDYHGELTKPHVILGFL